MKLAAAHAIPDAALHPEYIVPSVFNRRVAESVAGAAVATGVARRGRGRPQESATRLEAIPEGPPQD
jgi:malate dehydrogenase (oxaloacetate-decarboxylating)